MTSSRIATVTLTTVLVIVAAGCSGVQTLSFSNPPTTTQSQGAVSEATLPTDLSSIAQQGVNGVTTTTVPAIGPGNASLNGTVFGPNGPVAGATVEADRIVGDRVASTRTATAADGSWTIGRILGGRYRIRAWQSPSLDLTTPQLLFLQATQSLTVSLQLSSYPGPALAASTSPSPPVVGQTANLVVQATNPTVEPDGVLRYPPDVGASVTISGVSWQVTGSDVMTTDAEGEVLFQVTCQTSGSDPLEATVGSSAPVPLSVPPCVSPPTPTTSTTTLFNPCPTTTIPDGTATTTPFGGC
jgi:carboxypeptidase family protein